MFPFVDTNNNNATITKDKVNAYYDGGFWDWTRFGTADSTANCHSYTFGYGVMIGSTTTGTDRVRVDDGWTTARTYPGALGTLPIEFKLEHSGMITSVWYNFEMQNVGGRAQKMNVGAIYTIDYPEPGDAWGADYAPQYMGVYSK